MADTTEAQATSILEPIRKRSVDEQPSLIGAEIEKLIPKVSEAQAGLEQAKETRLVDSKLARAEESQKQTGITREEYQKGRGKLSQYEMPTFKPNQEDAMSFSQLGSLVGTLGVMLGAGGKASAKVALGSMTGMMNGWQKGRKDLYERELKTFNTEFKRIENIRKDILNDVEMSMKLRSTDAKAAEDYAEAARFKMGSGSVGEYLSRTGQLKGLMGYLNSQAKVAEAAKVTKDKYEQKIEEAARRLENQKELEGVRQQGRRDIASLRPEPAPQLLQVKNLDGSVSYVDARRLKTDSTGRIILPEGTSTIEGKPGASTGRVGQNALTFASRVYGNILNASTDLKNLTLLPKTSESPLLSGMINTEPATALGSIKAFVGREVTNADARAFDQVTNSLDAALARLEAQGVASGATQGAIKSFNALKPKAGDPALNMAMYIARVKQEIETGIRVHKEMPGATQGQKEEAAQELQKINKIIPFSVDDVLNIARGGRGTLNDKMIKLVQKPSIAQEVRYQGLSPSDSGPTQEIDKAGLRSKAAARIAAGGNPDLVAAKYKELTGEDY